MGERLELRTLGGLNIQRGGSPVTGFDSRKVAALLVYLACTGRTFPREVLAEMLWEERTQAQALSNLRVALHSLNQTLGDYVEITRETVGLRSNVEWWLDAREFEALLSAAGSDAARLDAALDLYRGDFLAGFFVDSSAYEQWATRERERLRLRAMEGLDRLIGAREAGGEYAAGIAAAARLLDLDPLREETYRQQMRLLALSGQRGKALEVYETCRRLLDTEFGLPPLPQTLALYEQLRAGALTPGLTPAAHAAEPLAPVYTLVENPYKGLCAFDEADEADFFGREALVERVLARLAEPHPLSRFLAVVGPSGSGKSSVVRAGVIPALRRGGLPGSAAWPIVTLLPGALPFDELEIALRRMFPQSPPALIDDLRRDARGLVRAARLCLPDEQQEMLVVIDQFEEVFTLVNDPGEARRFLDNLYVAAISPRSPLRIIITLRADFYDRPLMIPDFSELVRQRTEVITPMTPDELERAVAAPAQRVGVQVEPALLAAVVAEISQQPGALPMMEYALTEVFERRADHTLTLAAYESIGGALGALARRANEVYSHLNAERQTAARQMCLRLVTPGEGTEDTRRRTLQTELISAGGEAARAALHAFDRARLLTFDHDPRSHQPTVELAHEAIIREWTLLRAWVDESRDDVRMQRRLAALAAEWEQAERDTGYLLSGSRLTQYEEWAQSSSVALTREEDAYLDASVTEQRQQDILERERQAHELVLQRRAANRLRTLVAGLAVFLIAAVGLSLFAFGKQRQAEDAQATSDSNAMIAQNERDYARELALVNAAQAALAKENPETALALAIAANDSTNPSGQAQETLSLAAYPPGPIQVYPGLTGGVLDTVFSPDGSKMIAVDFDGHVILWDVQTAQPTYLEGHTGFVQNVDWSPDGRTALTASADLSLILWDTETGKMIRRLTSDEMTLDNGIATIFARFSPDGKHILSSTGSGPGLDGRDARLLWWDVETGQVTRTFEGHTRFTWGIGFSADGKLALSGAASGELILWDVTTGEIIRRFGEISDNWMMVPEYIEFSLDGHTALTRAFDGKTTLLWDMETLELVRRFEIPGTNWQGAGRSTFSPDGKWIAASGEVTVIWDVATGEQVAVIDRVTTSLDFTPDGRFLLLGNMPVTLWDLSNGAELQRFALPVSGGVGFPLYSFGDDAQNLIAAIQTDTLCEIVTVETVTHTETHRFTYGEIASDGSSDCTPLGMRVSPDGQTVLIARMDGRVELWEMTTGKYLRTFTTATTRVFGLAFSPDGRTAVGGSAFNNDGEIIMWDVSTGEDIRHFAGLGDTIWPSGITFSPDGRLILAGDQAGSVILWEASTGQEVRHFDQPVGGVNTVAFSRDGLRVLAGSDVGVFLWETATGRLIQRFSGNMAIYDTEERTVLSTNPYDFDIVRWDIASGEAIRRYKGASTSLPLLHPDGHSFFTTDGVMVYQWRMDTQDELMAWTLANRYVRDLTCEERAIYHLEPGCNADGVFPTSTPYLTATPALIATTLPAAPLLTPGTTTPTVPPHVLLTAQVGENRGEVAAGDYQSWEYAGRTGEKLTLRVQAEHPWSACNEAERAAADGGCLDSQIVITNPAGIHMNLIFWSGMYEFDPATSNNVDEENTDSLVENLVLPADGTYRITVSGFGSHSGGAYTLIIESTPPGTATATPSPEN